MNKEDMDIESPCTKTKLFIETLTDELLTDDLRKLSLNIKMNQFEIQFLPSFAHQVSVARKQLH